MNSPVRLTLNLLKQGADPAQILVKLALRKALLDCHTVLDVGCGPSLTLRQLQISHSTGLDGYLPAVEEARQKHTHDEIIHGDIRNLTCYFKPGQFDACIAIDVIEHLNKTDGLKLMAQMEALATKKVVFFTPRGFLKQGHSANDDLQEHLSGWTPAEMEQMGYRTTGFLGPKKMRGEYHILKSPRSFWSLASLAGHFARTRNHPEEAAAMLCVKTLFRE